MIELVRCYLVPVPVPCLPGVLGVEAKFAGENNRMLKKALFAAILTVSFVASVSTHASLPPPECYPRPYVESATDPIIVILDEWGVGR
jgi:hypothetical protein